MNRHHFHGVRTSLTAWYVAAMLVVLTIYAAGVFVFVSRSLSHALDAQLHADFEWAVATADRLPDGRVIWFDEDREGGEGAHWFQAWMPDGRVFRTAVAERNPIPENPRPAMDSDEPRIAVLATPGGTVRILTGSVTIFGRRVALQVARPERAMRAQLRQLVLLLALGLPLGVIGAGLGGYWLARRALAPIDRLTERARAITAERLHERLPVDDPEDELGRLACVFNDTLGRLESSFNQMRRFTADVSHQLRTPLTVIRSVGEVGLRGRRETVAYRETIESMLEEADRLASLVDRLLAFSRAELRETNPKPDIVDLHELAEEVATDLGVLAEEKAQLMTVEAEGAPRVVGDRLILRHSVINLVDNAIKYSPEGASIRIRVAESQDRASLEVIDDGPGISDDLRDYIFCRHYRGHGSIGTVGGNGLGLWIAKWAVELNGGELSCESAGRGSTFRITARQASFTPAADVSPVAGAWG